MKEQLSKTLVVFVLLSDMNAEYDTFFFLAKAKEKREEIRDALKASAGNEMSDLIGALNISDQMSDSDLRRKIRTLKT